MMGTGLWAETTEDVTVGIVFGIMMLVAVAGFAMQPRRPLLGAGLAILGSLCSIFYFWALIPFILIPAAIVTAVLRARRLGAPRQGTLLQNGPA
jgi:hypothetical protein